MSATTARTLCVAAGLLALAGAAIGSPAGGVLVLGLAALVAAAPAAFHRGRARWAGLVLALVALALAVPRWSEARRENERYRAHVQKGAAAREAP